MQIRSITQREWSRVAASMLSIFITLAIAFPVTVTAYAADPSQGPDQRSGTKILVTTTDDTLDPGDGLCSLREAIIAANTNSSSGDGRGECPAGTDDRKDIITLASGGIYPLTIDGPGEDEAQTGDLDIWDNTAEPDLIIGVQDGGTATIDASSLGDRVFDIFGSAVNMTGLNLTGGTVGQVAEQAGGGVQISGGSLTMASSVVTGNSSTWGGGIGSWGGTVKLSGTTISDNTAPAAGGGLFNNAGTMKVEKSVVSGNATADGGGGGIWSNSALYLASTDVSGNHASGGGGLYVQLDEGVTAQTRISDNTRFRGNTALNMGGGISNDGNLSMNGGEVRGNSAYWSGGGIFNRYLATMTLDGVTVADNLANNDGGGGVYNEWALSLTGSTISGNHANHDGGGITNTGTLIVDSSNLFSNSGQGGGALANWPDAMATIRNGTQVYDNSGSNGGGLFNYAKLTVANSAVFNNAAEFGGGLSNWGGELTLSNVTVSGNSARNSGGGIHNQDGGSVSVENGSVISGNKAGVGGGMDNWGGTVTLSGSSLSNNAASGGGGLMNFGSAAFHASQVTGNSVNWAGGGISNGADSAVLIDSGSAVSGNSSDVHAGGIWNEGSMEIRESTLDSNNAVAAGGALHNLGTLVIAKSVLSANSAGQGGALYNTEYGTATIRDGTRVINGTASDGGGGLFNLGNLTVDGTEVSGNWGTYGGGLFNWTGGTLTVSKSLIANNSANEGGGLHNKEGSTAVIQNGTTISGNSAAWTGGGLDNWGTLTVSGSVLLGNTSPGEGDAVSSGVNTEHATNITGSCIVGNGDTAVFNSYRAVQNATQNWWGDASGPSGDGPGSGDSVGPSIDFSNWLTEAPAICATP